MTQKLTSTHFPSPPVYKQLLKAAAKVTGDNVILVVENNNICLKATSAEDRVKTRCWTEISKAQIITV